MGAASRPGGRIPVRLRKMVAIRSAVQRLVVRPLLCCRRGMSSSKGPGVDAGAPPSRIGLVTGDGADGGAVAAAGRHARDCASDGGSGVGAFDRVLPFDVPFFITGRAPEGTVGLEVQYAVVPKSGDASSLTWLPGEPARWKPDGPTTAGQAFLVLVRTPLEARRLYRVRFVFLSARGEGIARTAEGRTAQKNYVSADAGILYAGDIGIGALYLGSNIYFRPVNKDASFERVRQHRPPAGAHRRPDRVVGFGREQPDALGSVLESIAGARRRLPHHLVAARRRWRDRLQGSEPESVDSRRVPRRHVVRFLLVRSQRVERLRWVRWQR